MTSIPLQISPTCWARIAAEAAELGFGRGIAVTTVRGYLLQGPLDEDQVSAVAGRLLADAVVERTVIAPVGDAALQVPPEERRNLLVHVLPKPGVMDPVAESCAAGDQ